VRKYLIVAALMVAVAGCQNKKKQTDTSALNPPAQPPVVYVPPSQSAAPTEVTSVPPADTVAPADTTPADVSAPAPSRSKSKTAHSTKHITGKTYVIKTGDTLYSISRARYGTNAHVKDILAANPGLNPNKLQVGQKIKLP
jgi:nucleoid-associated protein YgaU